jgi:hypothetical protein
MEYIIRRWQADRLTHFASLGTMPELELTEKFLLIYYPQLTSRRKEIYALDQIEGLAISSYRDWGFLVLGGFLVWIGLAGLQQTVGLSLMFVVFGAALAYFGWIGSTNIVIQQFEGDICFRTRGQAIGLREFANQVNTLLYPFSQEPSP